MNIANRLVIPNVPAGFDPDRHGEQFLQRIIAQRGPGWTIQSYDPEMRTITVVKREAITQVMGAEGDRKILRLRGVAKPSDGDRIAAETQDAYPGYSMTRFDPHLAPPLVELSRLSADEVRCREAVATALGVKPWDIQVSSRIGGGFTIGLPGSYVPSKHDDKLQEVAEGVIGRFGWYVDTDPRALTAHIIPSDPPMFPNSIPFPFEKIQPVTRFDEEGDKQWFTFELAEKLGEPGRDNESVQMSLDDSTALLLVGLPGSGKSVAIQSIVFQALVKGYRLAVINTPAKKTDYAWAKPYVHDHWWGCDDTGTSVKEALTVASLVDEEGQRMGALMDQYRVGKWQDLPENVKRANPPIFVVADELTAQLSKPSVPGGLSKEAKELPQFVEMAQDYLEAKLLTLKLSTLVAVHRAAGLREAYLTQRPSKTEGFPPELKSLIPHRILLGPTPSEADLSMAFRDPKKVCRVPTNIAVDKLASRGAGIVHLDGVDPMVIKGFFAPGWKFESELRRHLGPGDSSDERVRPTAAQIDHYVPMLEESAEMNEQPANRVRKKGARAPSGRSAREVAEAMGDSDALALMDSGGSAFERANAQRHAATGGGPTRKQKAEAREEAQWAQRSGEVSSDQMRRCPCGEGWLHPSRGCTACGAKPAAETRSR